jgi:hypothetical protein
MVLRGGRSTNLSESLKDADHALPVLCEEGPRLLDHLLIVKSAREYRSDNNS